MFDTNLKVYTLPFSPQSVTLRLKSQTQKFDVNTSWLNFSKCLSPNVLDKLDKLMILS